MPEKTDDEQSIKSSELTDNDEPSWFKRSMSALGIEAPFLVLFGVVVGVIITYAFLIKLPIVTEPLIGISVRATIDAQEADISTDETSTEVSTATASSSTLTPDALSSISIEDFQGKFYDFSSDDGYGGLDVIRGDDGDLDYRFIYEMPQNNEDAYAGIFFEFAPTNDLTDFESLQIAISFGDNDAICQVYLEDENDKQSFVTLGTDGSSAIGDAKKEVVGDMTIFTIPLAENFTEPNMQSIRGIGISISSGLVKDYHTCTVQDLKLLR